MRVYEIAKEVGIPNKDLIAKIRALGLEVNNHMSSLDADDVARIKRSLEKEKAGDKKVIRHAKMHVEVKVMLVGGMVEERIISDLRQSYDKGTTFTNDYIKKNGLG